MEEQITVVEVPKSIEAEQCVLGCILIDPDSVLSSVMEVLTSKYFYDDVNAKIFTIISTLAINGIAIDPVEVLNQSLNNGLFESEMAGNSYIASIMEKVPTVANVMSYCNIVIEKYNLRNLLSISNRLKDNVLSGKLNSQSILETISQEIFDIRQGNEKKGLIPIKDIMFATYDKLCKMAGLDKDKYRGLSTGFHSLDSTISGLNKSDLIIVAARPGMGKTSFALNIATNVAKSYDKQVAIFSLEMSNEQLASRILSSESHVDSHKLRAGRISGEDWVNLAYSAESINRLKMYIDDTAGITVQTIKSRVQNIQNLGLVVIDYLQLMSSNINSDNRVTIISEITRNIKVMAKDLDIPIILLSQLSRSPESRNDKRPMLSDLRESGSIEQDADIVLFLYRDAYYNKASEEKNISECIVAKNRHGETGTIKLGWNGAFTKFTNLETKLQEPS
ncbi:MAG: replicative DNA helicase [Ruminococcus sp.]|nr:replicative DNA helicase [Ruminococcus sp.]